MYCEEGRGTPFLFQDENDDDDAKSDDNHDADEPSIDATIDTISDYRLRDLLSRSNSELEALESSSSFDELLSLACEDMGGDDDAQMVEESPPELRDPGPYERAQPPDTPPQHATQNNAPQRPDPAAISALLKMVKSRMEEKLVLAQIFVFPGGVGWTARQRRGWWDSHEHIRLGVVLTLGANPRVICFFRGAIQGRRR